MDFTDLASRYLQTRMDQATQPFTDPNAYMSQRLGLDTSANVQPKSTTITYNDDGTQTVTEKKDVTPAPQPQPQYLNLANSASTQPVSYQPQPIAPIAPQPPVQEQPPVQQAPVPQMAPPAGPQTMPQGGPPAVGATRQPLMAPPSQPPAPDQTYQRMIQAESGGQNYAPNGQPLTSPAGAMFAAQVMPSTAQNPGYGVRPAAAQTPEEYNRVGQDYYNAMLNKFGNPQAAAAAYNAGPGRVQQNLVANNGQLNVGQLPQETQAYLQKVGLQQTTGTNGPAPGVPPAPSAGAPAISQYQQTTNEPATEKNWHEHYGKQVVNNLNNPAELFKISEDPNAPEFAKIAANRQAFELLKSKKDEQEAVRQANKDLESGNTLAIANALKKRSDEGSYIKAYLFSRLGLNDLAKDEQEKLGAGRVWEQQQLPGGIQTLIQRDAQGLPLYGIDQNGRELSGKELIQFGGAPVKGAAQHAQVYKDPFGNVKGNFALETRPGRAPVFREIGTGRLASPDEAQQLNAVGVAGPLEQIYASNYLKGGGAKQGANAAEGYAQGTLPGAPGYQGMPSGGAPAGGAPAGAAPAGAAPAQGGAVQGAPTTPVVSGAPAPSTVIPSANANVPVYQQKKAANIAEKRSESFNKIIDTEYRENAGKGEIISNNRKLQFDILNRDDPTTGKKVAEQISGLYNAANEDIGNQKLSILRDIFTGKLLPEQDASKRIAELNVSPAVKSALQEYNSLNAQIAGQTLRETAGPGSVSDAEQAANKARNVDITRAPMLGAYNIMGQSQFNGDLQRYKADLAASPNNTASNATAFDRDFRAHQAQLIKSYREVAEARLKFIQDNGSGPGAIREGYKRYPVPEYDPTSGNWKYLKPLSKIITKKEEQT